MKSIEQRIARIEDRIGRNNEKLIVVRMWSSSEEEACPGYDVKLANARMRIADRTAEALLIACPANCKEKCELNKGGDEKDTTRAKKHCRSEEVIDQTPEWDPLDSTL